MVYVLCMNRLALLRKSGEEDWRNRINKKQDVVKVAISERHAQLWEVEQTFKKKVNPDPYTFTPNLESKPIRIKLTCSILQYKCI